ncbi:MAG: Adenine DNA glycosylase [Phycisphaerae bacterium]|nr:Adenine DNA glycosylase [Phycisphaerae bacterium]
MESDPRPIRRRLLRWFAQHQRTLPWRSDPTPYRVWVSEIMLQQTQVATVIPYFERFVRRFSDVAALAAADLQDVLAVWAGLGYYSRARNLHRAAGLIASAGRFPDTLEGLLALPGVGRYTAGAILSIAFDKPAPILDGNVARVLCRLSAIGGDPKSPAVRRRLWSLAETLVPPRRPSQFNQAMMELGALVCTPRSPLCGRCPLAALCEAKRQDRPEAYPAAGRKTRVLTERWAVALVRRGGCVLMTRRAEGARWGGLWEFPGTTVAATGNAEADLRRFLKDELSLSPSQFAQVGRVRHQLTHRNMTVEVFAAAAPKGRPSTASAWVAPANIEARPISKLTRKIAALL